MHLLPRRASSPPGQLLVSPIPRPGPPQRLMLIAVPPPPATSGVAFQSLTEVRLEMMTYWRFSIWVSLSLFIAILAVVSFLTPAPQKVAGKINDPTLKAAAAIKMR